MEEGRARQDRADSGPLAYQSREQFLEAADEVVGRQQRRVALAWFAVVVGTPLLLLLGVLVAFLVFWLR